MLAVRMPAGRDFLGVLERVWSAGNAVLPLSPALPDTAVSRILAELRPAAVVEPGGERRLRDGIGVTPGTALVVVTSGSTAGPKGVVLSHQALEASLNASLDRLGATPDDQWLCCLPVDHIAGLQVLLRARRLGRHAIVQPGFAPEAVAAARTATHVSLVPTMLARLLDAGVDLSGFRRILVGGAAAPEGLLDRARRAGAHVTVTYGMTETCGGCLYDGLPLDGVACAVDPDGRIAIRGKVLFDGYRLRPAETERVLSDGWFLTDDRGEWEPGGGLQVLGRLDDVIVSGGVNVPAAEVAAVLARHPGVADVAVLGRPDAEWGERVVAVVVAAGGTPPTLEELRALVHATAPAAYAPKELLLTERLPRTPLGKLNREALRSSVSD